MVKKTFPYLLLSLLFMLPFLMGGICDGGGNGGGTTPTVAAVNLSVKWPSGFSNVNCTSRLIWNFTPGTLTGTSGTSTPFAVDHNYSSTSDSYGVCYFSDLITNMKVGTWTIAVTDGAWVTSCVQTLAAGTNNLKFTIGRAGCTTGLNPYPGG
ncbi:MAG: hypothetical protein LLF28_04580 [Nitrospiraceae bacterium]|nr:hypothetical protein [Nitrospiraceae bacterium]